MKRRNELPDYSHLAYQPRHFREPIDVQCRRARIVLLAHVAQGYRPAARLVIDLSRGPLGVPLGLAVAS